MSLNDLSPAATFISANYNIPFDVGAFKREGEKLLKKADKQIGWMYRTLHSDGRTEANIQYTVWSDTFNCHACAGEIVFTDAALDVKTKRVSKTIVCPHCGVEAAKEQMELAFESFIDSANGSVSQRPKRVPSLIVYKIGKKTYEKRPDKKDIERLSRISELALPTEMPTVALPDCQMTRVGRMRDYAH